MESYAAFEYMGYRWSVKSEFTDLLRETVIPLILRGEDSPALQVVKRKLTRDSLIVSLDDPATDVFVKIHKYDKLRERIKATVGHSRASRERRIGDMMLARGLPVAEPLGLGERRSRGIAVGSVLMMRALPGCTGLDMYLHARYPAPVRSRPAGHDEFLRALGRLVRQVHASGFWHPDLHASNILVDAHVSPPRLWLIDLHAAGMSRLVSRRRRMADLAKLIFSLEGLLDDSRLREVLAGYEPEAGPTEILALFTRLSKRADSLRKRRIRSRAKRCLKTSGSFVVEKQGDARLYRRREIDTATVLRSVDKHGTIWSRGGPELVKHTANSVLTAFPLPDGRGERIYVKEFANTGPVRALETVFYVHRGKRAWKASNLLRILDVPCPEPLALVEKGNRWAIHTSYLIMREIPDAVRLDEFLLDKYFRISSRLTHPEIADKREFIRLGARALREFHSKKIYHKDLSPKNLLVNTMPNGKLRFYCVDSDSVQFPLRLSLRRRIKNLAQLNGVPTCITTTDKIRFYKEYFGLLELTPKHRLFVNLIFFISRRRSMRSREADRKIRERAISGAETHEDIASL